MRATAPELGVFYYGAVLQDLPDEQGVKPLPGGRHGLARARWRQLPELAPEAMRAEQARVQAELAESARFYWRNSRFNCAFDYTWFTRLHPTPAQHDQRRRRAVLLDRKARRRTSRRCGTYDGLLQVAVLYVYDKNTGQLKRVKGGGGFTNGCDAAKHHCGWSWWAACSADNVCGSDWLMVHEFGHQLDSLFDAERAPRVLVQPPRALRGQRSALRRALRRQRLHPAPRAGERLAGSEVGRGAAVHGW